MHIDLQKVKSRRIAEVGYDSDSQTLGIRFRPNDSVPAGAIYHYDLVPYDVYDDFITADSLWNFFTKQIKGKYAYRKVDEEDNEEGKPVAPATVTTVVPQAETSAIVPQVTIPADEPGLRSRALEVSHRVSSLKITSPEQYSSAATLLLQVAAERKLVQARVNQVKKPAYAAYQATLRLEKDVVTPYETAETWLKTAMSQFRAKLEQAKRQEARQRQAEEDAKAEAEAKAKAQAIVSRQATVAREKGDEANAQAIEQAPLPLVPQMAPLIILPREVPKIKGIVEGRGFGFRRTNDDDIPRDLCSPDDTKIRKRVNSLGLHANIPGVEVFEEFTTGTRARA